MASTLPWSVVRESRPSRVGSDRVGNAAMIMATRIRDRARSGPRALRDDPHHRRGSALTHTMQLTVRAYCPSRTPVSGACRTAGRQARPCRTPENGRAGAAQASGGAGVCGVLASDVNVSNCYATVSWGECQAGLDEKRASGVVKAFSTPAKTRRDTVTFLWPMAGIE